MFRSAYDLHSFSAAKRRVVSCAGLRKTGSSVSSPGRSAPGRFGHPPGRSLKEDRRRAGGVVEDLDVALPWRGWVDLTLSTGRIASGAEAPEVWHSLIETLDRENRRQAAPREDPRGHKG